MSWDPAQTPRFGALDVLPERFWNKVRLTDTCWIWIAGKSKGYGVYAADGMNSGGAHRASYEAFVGPLGALYIDHLCKTPACVNPAHMEPVTNSENVRRGNAGLRNRLKTHCPHGHPYAGENLIVTNRGERVCKACHYARVMKRDRRLRAMGLK